LVPYTGIFPIDHSLDHTGPMAESVTNVATALEVLAGPDGLDPRQPAGLEAGDYTDALIEDASGMTIAVLEEGFEREESDETVNDTVHSAIDEFEDMGAETTDVSVPRHLDSLALWIAIAGQGGVQVLKQGGVGSLHDGWYNTELAETFTKFAQSDGRDFPASVKPTWLAIEYLNRQAKGSGLYAKAQNVTLAMREAYDEILAEADIIALPTIPLQPFEIDPDFSRVERVARSLPIAKNTAPFDLTHHPAISIPAGTTGDLPVGLMLVGDRFDEESVLRAAYAFEQGTDWGNDSSANGSSGFSLSDSYVTEAGDREPALIEGSIPTLPPRDRIGRAPVPTSPSGPRAGVCAPAVSSMRPPSSRVDQRRVSRISTPSRTASSQCGQTRGPDSSSKANTRT
jgi:amidase